MSSSRNGKGPDFKKSEKKTDAAPERLDQAADNTISVKAEDYKKMEEAARLAEEFKDKYLRAHAELDNARKRLLKEKEEFLKFANEDLLSEIVYIVDNFDRALEHMNGTQKVEAVLQGIRMIQRQFHVLLDQNGVKRIEALGKKFDPQMHEAVGHVDTGDDKDGLVVEEVQPGYLIKERLLRPAVVKVGKKK